MFSKGSISKHFIQNHYENIYAEKEGNHLDLPIAVSILKANDQIKADLNGDIFIGELALNGEIRSVKGILPMI
ncbi:MAG: hypothetical protein N3E48_03845, partial [Candidatus Bathyarchaeota archaeon]|nr:hypothetical protein [Candidatus Bathyarchaeota archaeon]